MILASLEILLSHGSPFWPNIFCRHLAYIAIDKSHLLWGWQEFRKEYTNIGKLHTFFSDISIMVLSATIIYNVLEYIYESLHLRTPVYVYKQTLDWPNITYMVKQIK